MILFYLYAPAYGKVTRSRGKRSDGLRIFRGSTGTQLPRRLNRSSAALIRRSPFRRNLLGFGNPGEFVRVVFRPSNFVGLGQIVNGPVTKRYRDMPSGSSGYNPPFVNDRHFGVEPECPDGGSQKK
jgi:hypothetical protein